MKCIAEEKPTSPSKSDYTYSIEFLAHLAMSPRCLAQPNDWDRITQEYPDLIRNVSIYYIKKFCFETFLGVMHQTLKILKGT